MARAFNGSTQYGEYAGAVVTAAPLTLAAWVLLSGNNSNRILGIYSGGDTTNRFIITSNGTASTPAAAANTGIASATANMALGWNHVCGVFTSATSRDCYLNGGNKGSNATSAAPSSLTRTAIAVQDNSTRSLFLAATIAEACIWNAALTASEVAALAAGVSPLRIRPGSLAGYWPLGGIDSPERDWTHNAHAMTLTASPTAANHAPVEPYSRRFWGSAPLIEAAAGGAVLFRRSLLTSAGAGRRPGPGAPRGI